LIEDQFKHQAVFTAMEIFLAALDALKTARAALLDEACSGNVAVTPSGSEALGADW
jgi:hypothetical protein